MCFLSWESLDLDKLCVNLAMQTLLDAEKLSPCDRHPELLLGKETMSI